MGSESMMKGTVPVCSKDFGKKKRTNRWAKLKQEKLGARREQWLSQAKNKGCKDESNGGGVFNKLYLPPKDEQKQSLRNSEVGSRGDESSDLDSVTNCPINSVLGGNNSRKDRPGSSSGSCSSRSACFSESISEEEEGEEREEEDGCLDDWEAVADALTAEDIQKNPNFDPPVETDAPIGSLDPPETPKLASGVSVPKPESKRTAVPIAEASNRAWRSDDAFRPQSLPNLSKQRSFPAKAVRRYFRGAVTWSRSSIVFQPSSCPICCEDLDLTDSSFLPCPCGFRLCLFCHKRILEDNGRCPGCRKLYDNPINREAGINWGASSFRLPRSCSMNTRS